MIRLCVERQQNSRSKAGRGLVNVETEQAGDYFQVPVCEGQVLRGSHEAIPAPWRCCHRTPREASDLPSPPSHARLPNPAAQRKLYRVKSHQGLAKHGIIVPGLQRGKREGCLIKLCKIAEKPMAEGNTPVPHGSCHSR